jgi:hypothetical protein
VDDMTTLPPFSSANYLDSGGYDTAKSGERVTDLRERIQRACFSRGHDHPLEKPAHARVTEPQEACGTVVLFRLDGGRLLARRVDCGTKACPKCGPRLRAEYATGYTTVLATSDPVYRLQVPTADWRRLQARLRRRGARVLRIPAPAGQLTIYTTADLGHLVDGADLADQVTADFQIMPSDRRNVSASRNWRDAYHRWRDQHDHDQAADASAEWLGRLGRPLEHVAMIARELGMLVGERRSHSLELRDPPDAATWQRFCALARLNHPGGVVDRAKLTVGAPPPLTALAAVRPPTGPGFPVESLGRVCIQTEPPATQATS